MGEVFHPVIALAVAVAVERKEYIPKNKRKKYGKWSKDWYLKLGDFGHTKLLLQLRENESLDFRNFLRLDNEAHDYLLEMI